MPKKKNNLENVDNQLDNTAEMEAPEEEVIDEEYDAAAVKRDIEDTITRAEGSFSERNGLKATKKNKRRTHKNVIGEEQIKNALETLKKYKSGKANLDRRVIENEEWWKLRHWQQMHNDQSRFVKPTSAWLFNSMMNKLADYSDNYPEPNIRARTQADVAEAARIKNILPMIHEAMDFEKTYIDACLAKIKNGTAIVGVFWNSDKDDIDVKNIDLLSIYWEPYITDIQASRNVFTVELVDDDLIEEMYPGKDFSTGDTLLTAKYMYEDGQPPEGKTPVVDWYYKKKGKLHYCKFVNDTVLIATENEPTDYPNGLYDDGNYPFVVDTLFKMEGTIAGFGYLDVCKSPQEYIDRLDQAISTNALLCAVPRYFIRKDATINKKEFLDWNNSLVECGNLNEDNVRQIVVNQLGSEIFTARDEKVNELKQTSGNADVNTGSSAYGVTAASAISQLIETGSKGSRLAIKGTYRACRQIWYLEIERMRQFYTEPRYVRVVGDDGTEQFDLYDNSGLVMQQEKRLDGSVSYRMPQFDIEVSAQKASPYNKMSQNELALQFYQYQFFNPQNADATLAALDMMDFDHKDDIIAKVKENGTLYDMVMQMQQQVAMLSDENFKLKAACDAKLGTNLLGGASASGGAMPQQMPQGATPTGSDPSPEDTQRALGKRSNSLNSGDGSNSKAEQLRRRAADATEVV